MFFWVIVFPVILMLGIAIFIITALVSEGQNKSRRILEGKQKAEQLKQSGYRYVLVDPAGRSVALCPDRRELLFEDLKERWSVGYETLRTVSLTPVSEARSETTGMTRTNRGSQIVSAAIGGVVGGPVGAAVGGLSGAQTSQSTTTHLNAVTDYELEVQLLEEDHPRIILHAGTSGIMNSVSYEMAEKFKDMAARLANIIHHNSSSS